MALVVALGTCWWFSLWHGRRRLAMLMLAAGAMLVIAAATYVYGHEVHAYRMERLRLYQAALAAALEGFPWGWGSYGSTHINTSASEAARHLTATGGWALHAHNEVLDVLLTSGPVGLVLWLTVAWAVASRARRIIDPVMRLACTAMLAAVAAHMMTDPVYGQDIGQLYLAVMMALVYASPASPGAGWRPPPLRWNMRLLLWPFVLCAVWGASRAIYPAVLHADAEPSARIKCHSACLHPQWASLLYSRLIGDPTIDLVVRRRIAAENVAKLGLTMANIPPQLAIPDPADPRLQATEIMRFVTRMPFERLGYLYLDVLLKAHPELSTEVPAATLARLPYLRGDRGLPVPDLDVVPGSMDEAIDCFAHLLWALDTGVPMDRIAPGLHNLCQRYVDIPGISLIAVEAGLEKPEIFDFLRPYRANMQETFNLRAGEILAGIKTSEQARRAMPLVRFLWQSVVEDCEAGRMSPIIRLDTAFYPIHGAVVRVWGLSRIAPRPAPAPVPPAASR
jgi:hypothetical protein